MVEHGAADGRPVKISNGRENTMELERRIYGIGAVSSLLQVMPDEFKLVAGELGIGPQLTINQIPHYGEKDIERVAAVLRNRPAEVETAHCHDPSRK